MSSIQHLFDVCDDDSSFHQVDDNVAFDAVKKAVQADLNIIPQIATETYNDETLLMVCIRTEKVKTATYILKCAPKAAACSDSQGYFPLHQAIGTRKLELIELLCDIYPGAVSLCAGMYKESPLLFAVEDHSVDVTKLLLTKGAIVTDEVWKHCKPTSFDTAEMKLIRMLVATL